MTDSQAFTKLLEDFGTNQRAQATLETELRQLDITFNQRALEIKQLQFNVSRSQTNQIRLQSTVAGLQEELRSHGTELNFQMQTRSAIQDLLDNNENEAKVIQRRITGVKHKFVFDALSEQKSIFMALSALREKSRNKP